MPDRKPTCRIRGRHAVSKEDMPDPKPIKDRRLYTWIPMGMTSLSGDLTFFNINIEHKGYNFKNI